MYLYSMLSDCVSAEVLTNQQSWVVVHPEVYPKTSASSLCLCLYLCLYGGGSGGGGGDVGGLDPGWVSPGCSLSCLPPGAAVGPQWRLSASLGWHQGQTEGGERQRGSLGIMSATSFAFSNKILVDFV